VQVCLADSYGARHHLHSSISLHTPQGRRQGEGRVRDEEKEGEMRYMENGRYKADCEEGLKLTGLYQHAEGV
jgi:hypothetical protein